MKWLWILCILGCGIKYEVVQEVHPGMYHTVGIKNKDVIIYKTDTILTPGDIVKIPNKTKRDANK